MDKHISTHCETKTLNYSAIGPRHIFRCPDNEWKEWFTKWKRGDITIEPFPFNHFLWSV